MKKFMSAVLFFNGCIDMMVGAGLIFFLYPLSGLLDYPLLAKSAVFSFGGWGTAAICFGVGRIFSSFDEKKVRPVGIFRFAGRSAADAVLPHPYRQGDGHRCSSFHTSLYSRRIRNLLCRFLSNLEAGPLAQRLHKRFEAGQLTQRVKIAVVLIPSFLGKAQLDGPFQAFQRLL